MVIMELDYEKIINRMLISSGQKNASGIARSLGITPQAVSNYKKKGELPATLVIRFADVHSISLDWLITGRGEMHRPPGGIASLSFSSGEAAHSVPSASVRPDGKSDFPVLNADEIIYIGKLLKVLRAPVKSAVLEVKRNIDTLFSSVYPGL